MRAARPLTMTMSREEDSINKDFSIAGYFFGNAKKSRESLILSANLEAKRQKGL